MSPPFRANVQCPKCSHSYAAPVFSVIDVGQTPELKQAFLAGQLNVSQCPQCGNPNYIATPILYHDPEHEFLGVFIPQQMNMSETQRQTVIGDLTKDLMDALPAEQRRGYMFTPQQFLTVESLAERILGFDGITPEMMAASRRKIDLLMELAGVVDDTLAFHALVNENKPLLDEEFFMLLGNFIMSAEQEGQDELLESLENVREQLLPVTEVGQRIQKQRAAVERLGESPTREEVFQAVIDADIDEIDAITVAVAPALDYQFFQDFTTHLETTTGEERAQLEQKRARMLEIIEDLRESQQQQSAAAQQVLQSLLAAEDMEQAVEENLAAIDNVVMSVLAANIVHAREQGATAAVSRLEALYELILTKVQQSLPPEIALYLQLAEAEYPDGTREILRENKELVTAEFLSLIEANLAQLETKEDATDQDRQLGRHMNNVLTQARLGG